MSENDDLVAVVDQLAQLVSDLAGLVSKSAAHNEYARALSIQSKAGMLKGRVSRAA